MEGKGRRRRGGTTERETDIEVGRTRWLGRDTRTGRIVCLNTSTARTAYRGQGIIYRRDTAQKAVSCVIDSCLNRIVWSPSLPGVLSLRASATSLSCCAWRHGREPTGRSTRRRFLASNAPISKLLGSTSSFGCYSLAADSSRRPVLVSVPASVLPPCLLSMPSRLPIPHSPPPPTTSPPPSLDQKLTDSTSPASYPANPAVPQPPQVLRLLGKQ